MRTGCRRAHGSRTLHREQKLHARSLVTHRSGGGQLDTQTKRGRSRRQTGRDWRKWARANAGGGGDGGGARRDRVYVCVCVVVVAGLDLDARKRRSGWDGVKVVTADRRCGRTQRKCHPRKRCKGCTPSHCFQQSWGLLCRTGRSDATDVRRTLVNHFRTLDGSGRGRSKGSVRRDGRREGGELARGVGGWQSGGKGGVGPRYEMVFTAVMM